MKHDLELMIQSVHLRKKMLEIIKNSKAGHTGGGMSCIDILNVLYHRVLRVSPHNPKDPGRDYYIQSKGHCVEALYVTLASAGFFPEHELATLNQAGSHFIGHPTRHIPGVEQNTGSLGHGMAFAVGVALSLKRDQKPNRVYTLLGDGELGEGSNWESAMAAAHYQLDQLTVIIDRNKLQITAPTEEVIGLEPLRDKFTAFGFAVQECDGNSVPELVALFDKLPFAKNKPNLILAHTVKGKGVSYMENKLAWHHKVPTAEEYAQAMAELDAQEQQLTQN